MLALIERYRSQLALAGLALALCILMSASWHGYRLLLDGQRRLADAQAQSAYLEEATSRLRRLRAQQAAALANLPETDLMQQLTSSAATYLVPIERVTPAQNGQANVWFKDCKFEDVIKWLWFLEVKQGLAVTQLSIERHAVQGWVSGFLALQGGRGG